MTEGQVAISVTTTHVLNEASVTRTATVTAPSGVAGAWTAEFVASLVSGITEGLSKK